MHEVTVYRGKTTRVKGDLQLVIISLGLWEIRNMVHTYIYLTFTIYVFCYLQCKLQLLADLLILHRYPPQYRSQSPANIKSCGICLRFCFVYPIPIPIHMYMDASVPVRDCSIPGWGIAFGCLKDVTYRIMSGETRARLSPLEHMHTSHDQPYLLQR